MADSPQVTGDARPGAFIHQETHYATLANNGMKLTYAKDLPAKSRQAERSSCVNPGYSHNISSYEAPWARRFKMNSTVKRVPLMTGFPAMVSLSTLILFSSWASDCIASPSNKVSIIPNIHYVMVPMLRHGNPASDAQRPSIAGAVKHTFPRRSVTAIKLRYCRAYYPLSPTPPPEGLTYAHIF